MNDILNKAKEDVLAIPANLKRFEQKAKKEIFVQTDAETGSKDEAVKSV